MRILCTSYKSVSLQDIDFLSAKTGHEFALLKGKKNDILFHGDARHCIFDDDREFLQYIGQSESKIVS